MNPEPERAPSEHPQDDDKTELAGSFYYERKDAHEEAVSSVPLAKDVAENAARLRAGKPIETPGQRAAPNDPTQALPLLFGSETKVGKYQLLEVLGRGGQGTVYRALDPDGEREVAIKCMNRESVHSLEHRERFLLEARTASRLEHPGICSVYDVGHHDGVPYIAMRLVRGQSLRAVLGKRQALALAEETESPPASSSKRTSSGSGSGRTPLEIRAVLGFMEALCMALDYAHGEGFLHRDLKPENIMVDEAGNPVLLDFGLARSEESLEEGSISIVGTRPYMAPEQSAGLRPSRETDTWALGIMLYELLTLERPFKAKSRADLGEHIAHAPTPDPRGLNRDIPSDVSKMIEVALDKTPRNRYSTAAAFAEDLRRVREHRPILARPPGPLHRLHHWVLRNPAIASLLALAVLVPWGFAYTLQAHATELEASHSAKDAADKAAEASDTISLLTAFATADPARCLDLARGLPEPSCQAER